jgi:O-antigen/teichoic acid export membrane protein
MDRDKVASNTLYYFLDFAIMVGAGYLLWIILGNMLAPEQYGMVFTVISMFSVLAIITSFGMQESLPKLIPEFRDHKAAGAMIDFAINSVAVFAFIISGLIYFLSPNISNYLYGSLQMALPLQFLAYVLFSGRVFFVL